MMLFTVLVPEELITKFGGGSVSIEQCHKCGYEERFFSEGVHWDSSTGVIRVNDTDDIFKCPICNPPETAGIAEKDDLRLFLLFKNKAKIVM